MVSDNEEDEDQKIATDTSASYPSICVTLAKSLSSLAVSSAEFIPRKTFPPITTGDRVLVVRHLCSPSGLGLKRLMA